MGKKKTKTPVEHAFGSAYGKWLNLLENYEDFMEGRIKANKVKPFYIQPDLFTIEEHKNNNEAWEAQYHDLMTIWGANAHGLRSSFKFKLKATDFLEFLRREKVVSATTYLPFENVYLQVEHEVEDDETPLSFLLFCERRTLDQDYPELNLAAGEEFICLTPAGYKDTKGVGSKGISKGITTYPIEIHVLPNIDWEMAVKESFAKDGSPSIHFSSSSPDKDSYVEAIPRGVNGEGWRQAKNTEYFMQDYLAFLTMLQAQGVKQTTHGSVKGANVVRRKPKHKNKHPMYEYRVLELGVGHEEPAVNLQIPRECAKKRLHAVRGFWRHYKKPLKSGENKGKTKVFVKDHWRGDKELGVVRKDYALNTKRMGE